MDATVAAGLALVRPVDGLDQLFVIDPDGSARQLTGLPGGAAPGAAIPRWSPDRSMIAFAPPSIGAGLDPQLWLVNADGSGQRDVASVGETTTWSPDSTRLLWMRVQSGVVRALQGTTLAELVEFEARPEQPRAEAVA